MSVIGRIFPSKTIVNLQKRLFISTRTFSVIANADKDINIVRSEMKDIVVPDVTIPELVFSAIEPYHKFTAIECAITGKKYTFGELRVKSENLGRMLRAKFKLEKGDVVAVLLQNCPDFYISTLGILFGGMVITSLNPLYMPEEISRQLSDSGAKLIITQSHLYNNVHSGILLTKRQIPIVLIKEKEGDSLPAGTVNFEELINTKVEASDIRPGKVSDLAFLPYSSGTTGLPKGVQLLHYNLLANLCQVRHPEFSLASQPTDSYQDVVPMVLPMYHIYGFTLGVLLNLTCGSKTVTLPKFTPDTFVSILKNYKVTHIYAAPPLVLFLSSNPDVKPEYFSSLKLMNSGAAPLGYSDELRFIEKIKNEDTIVRQGYGLTETSPVISFTPKDAKSSEEIGGSIGKLVASTLAKIVAPDDPTGKPLGPNEQGELLVKGPQVMKGYHNNPEETEKAFLDGWFRTGDLAYYNEDRFFFITDRLKELIKVKGFQVPPAELEALIRCYPCVEDAAVIGIPHPIQGEVPRAYVVVKKDMKLDSEELKEFVASKVAKYKRLEGGVEILDAIPKNPSGKILRRQLKLQYAENNLR